jgi:hypothetical protein
MRFDQVYGMPRNPPESYWPPWLGHWCHVSPSEFGNLTCEQLMSCFEFATEDSEA